MYVCVLLLQAFRAGDHQEALVYYTRSIKFCPSAAAYNNRAITGKLLTYNLDNHNQNSLSLSLTLSPSLSGIKLGRNEEAISDCVEVLKLEPDNTKGKIDHLCVYL